MKSVSADRTPSYTANVTDLLQSSLEKLPADVGSLMELLSSMEGDYGLPALMDDFCKKLDASQQCTRISFSAENSSYWLSAEQCAGLYLVVCYLCTGIVALKACYAYVVFRRQGRKVILILDTDLALFNLMEAGETYELQQAFKHIRTINGRVKGHCFDFDDRVYRLTLYLDHPDDTASPVHYE